jgi:hypothetical protein
LAPQTKPPNQRRRRNAGQSQWRDLPAEGRKGEAPKLPDAEWLDSTREWWERIWASPMATIWIDGDLDSLIRLARLRDEFARGDLPISGLSAIQQLEDRFGLSPKSRRALQWEIKKGDVVEMPTRKPRRLRAIDTG